ncbi:hypothetical protein HOLleu_31615 [Holothuria leucospilota]|uniref:Uncharacterized protein n=1 Tax=Holothuria leucospilota TaxID=206669 RepID=A0A9Q1BHV7_HOLLE|nr:hypothetical protein HOLleu_31615 [Holothuria leucospilota]
MAESNVIVNVGNKKLVFQNGEEVPFVSKSEGINPNVCNMFVNDLDSINSASADQCFHDVADTMFEPLDIKECDGAIVVSNDREALQWEATVEGNNCISVEVPSEVILIEANPSNVKHSRDISTDNDKEESKLRNGNHSQNTDLVSNDNDKLEESVMLDSTHSDDAGVQKIVNCQTNQVQYSNSDVVWADDSVHKDELGAKWKGPFKATQVINNGILCELQDLSNCSKPIKVIHYIRLKPYQSPFNLGRGKGCSVGARACEQSHDIMPWHEIADAQ